MEGPGSGSRSGRCVFDGNISALTPMTLDSLTAEILINSVTSNLSLKRLRFSRRRVSPWMILRKSKMSKGMSKGSRVDFSRFSEGIEDWLLRYLVTCDGPMVVP